MPTSTMVLLKFTAPPMSLKQFMLRSEVLKLYRGFMRLGRLIDPPQSSSTASTSSSGSPCSTTQNQSTSSCSSTAPAGDCSKKVSKRLHPLQLKWIDWVRSEFRLRQHTEDEEVVRMMVTQGKRQLQEMERTILLATNRNLNASSSSNTNESSSSCNQKRKEQPSAKS